MRCFLNEYVFVNVLARYRSLAPPPSGSRENFEFFTACESKVACKFSVFCSKSRFWKMNWGFQELGVSELTPDRPALNFEFVRCEKSCIFDFFFRDLGKYKLRGLEKFWVFWCISSPGTYLERCAVKFWPSLPPRLLILKTKTFPLCKNNENLEFRSQCHILLLDTTHK